MLRDFFKVILLGTVACVVAVAQQAGMTGSVVDTTDAVIVGAQVTARHVATNTIYETVVNDSGLYTFPLLPVGSYELSVSKEGFKRAVRSGILLQVDDKPTINFRLELGGVTETVEVQTSAPLVDTSSATVGKVIEQARIDSLPLNGRSVLSLVLLTPNVQGKAATTQAGFGDRGDAVTTFSINGGHPWLNAIILDGSNDTTPRMGTATVTPAVDAIEEFKVQSGVMSAEYGFTSGGVVNMVTKSGSNAFHGTLYEFLRNKDLTARNAFATSVAPLVYNQYGGSVGGPVIKNRTFFFFNFEEWRLTQGYAVLDTVPTVDQRAGDFSQFKTATGALIPIYDPTSIRPNPSGSGYISDPFQGNKIPMSKLDPVAQNLLKTFWPLPNATPTNAFTNANNFNTNLSGHSQARQIVVKADHRFSTKNNLSIKYILWDPKSDNGCCGSANAGIFPDTIARYRIDDYKNVAANISDTHAFSSSLLNEFRFGVADLYYPALAPSYYQGWPQKLGLPSNVPSATLPRTTIQGYANFPGSNATYLELFSAYTPQLIDNVTIIRGSHTMKVGADLRRNRFNTTQINNASGTYNFTSALTGNLLSPSGTGAGLASFITGAVATASVATDQPVTYQNYSQSIFFQDDWKVFRHVTLNLGLRWDNQQPMSETHNRLSTFNPYAKNPKDGVLGEQQYAGVDFGQSLTRPDRLNFSPRGGFAWDVFGNGNTALRGGYGIYYPSNFNARYFQQGQSGFSNFPTNYVATGGTTQLPAFFLQNGLPSAPIQPIGSLLGPSAFEGQTVSYLQPEGRNTYVQEWTVTLQQQLPGKFLIEAGYSGSKATRMVTVPYNLNQLNPIYYSLGNALNSQVPNPYAGIVSGAFGGPTITRQQSLLPYPYYGPINVVSARSGSSIYHSWLLNLERRMSNGFVLLASYTFGKLIQENTIGISSAQSLGDQIAGGDAYRLGPYNRHLDRGLDPTDPAGRVVVSGIYELPAGKGKMWQPANPFLMAVVGGWQLNGLMVANAGLPIVIRGANNFLADRPNSTGVSAKLSDPTQYKWFDTSQFVNPPSWTIGNVGNVLPDVRNPGTFNIDLSVIKNTKIKERFNLQFRAESFNFLNHVNLGAVNGTFVPGTNGLNSSSTFGTVTTAKGPSDHSACDETFVLKGKRLVSVRRFDEKAR